MPRRDADVVGDQARDQAGVPDRALTADQRAAWRRAADEYVATLRYNADRPESHVALGTLEGRRGQYPEAEEAFRAGLKLDPRYVPAYVNAADMYRVSGRDADALRILNEGIAAAPDAGALHHARGLTLVRQQDLRGALAALERATKLEPGNVRYAYVHAVALHSSGRATEAIAALERARKRRPEDREVLFALATMQRDAGRMDAARKAASDLVAAYPSDADARAFAAQLARPR